jgi:hypothetical protein
MGGATMSSSRKESVAKTDQPRGLNMKTYLRIINPTIAVLVFAVLIMLPGCWVSSVNGLVEEDFFHSDPDVTFDQGLTGAWEVTRDNCTTILTITAKEHTYDLQGSEQGEQCTGAGKKSYYEARLIKLDNHLFLDLSPRTDDVCEMCLPLHSIFLAKFDKDSLSLTPIDSDWLKNAVGKKTVTLATMPSDTDRLTASPKDLKAFCRRYADDKEAFAPVSDFVFKRK